MTDNDEGGDSRFGELQAAAIDGDLVRFGEVALDIWAPMSTESEVDARIREQLLDNRAAMLATFALAGSGPPPYNRLSEICGQRRALFVEDGATRDPPRNREWPRTHGTQWCAELVADPDALVLVAATDEEVVGDLVGPSPRRQRCGLRPAASW